MRKHDASMECHGEDGGGGILAYRHANVGNDNPSNVPNVSQPESHNSIPSMQRSDDFGGQGWQQIPTRERSTGPEGCNQGIIPPMLYTGYVEGQEADLSGTSNTDGPSNRPTPNSSSGSDNRQSASGNGQMGNSSGRASFDTSPIGSHRNLGHQAEMDAAAAFFQMSGGSTGMTPEQSFGTGETPGSGGFTFPNGFTGQTGMTPVAEGVLQQLMGDIPMDLRWDSGA